MSFYCRTHGWAHMRKKCPICFPKIVTSQNIHIGSDFQTYFEQTNEYNAKLADWSFYAKDVLEWIMTEDGSYLKNIKNKAKEVLNKYPKDKNE